VGDSAGLARKGAPVSFFVEANRVNIELNARAATQVGLEVQDALLRLPQVRRVDAP
jgi:hypothetical protein